MGLLKSNEVLLANRHFIGAYRTSVLFESYDGQRNSSTGIVSRKLREQECRY